MTKSMRAAIHVLCVETITFDFVHDEARHAYVTVRNEYVAKELYELYATEPSLAKAPAGQAGDERASRKSLPARRAISLDGKRVFVRLPKALQPSAQAALVVVVATARSVPARGLASRAGACHTQVQGLEADDAMSRARVITPLGRELWLEGHRSLRVHFGIGHCSSWPLA